MTNQATLRDDVKQLLWVGFEAQEAPDPSYGAVVLFKRNLVLDAAGRCDLDALVALCDRLHRGGALIAIDQEGGRVQRIKEPATVWPPMLNITDATTAEQVGKAMGDELAALGIDIDFAPVLDVHTNAANPIIGDRAFGRDADSVTHRALAYARGLASAGVLACGKHFPGHGDTDTDSHLALPRIDHAWPRLDTVELPPFAAAAKAELPMIMTAHVVFAAIDRAVPATLSRAVVTGLLRERLGYRGVIVSDDLDMKAIAATMGADTAAVAAIRAGCDALLLCRDRDNQRLAEQALIEAAQTDAELRARIGESAARIHALKAKRATTRPSRDVIGSAAHRALAEKLA
ncbi:MAG TPA: beta-N-acetylhexosaminidase [Kofleriaceae bacterium]|jgi:beta-N-acetylhexosaminidase|nr:beta-N-acetylhexosaminidase [Kofleriaceae bacterium]